MTGSTEEHRIDDSSVMPGPTAFHPPLVPSPPDRFDFELTSGELRAWFSAIVHSRGNSPVAVLLAFFAPAAVAALFAGLCHLASTPGWAMVTVAGIAFVSVSAASVWLIFFHPPRTTPNRRR